MRATAYNTQSHTIAMAKPEILPGKPSSMTCRYEENRPNSNGVWQLLRYDRVHLHHIAFAAATTDQCSIALFRASTPAVAAPNADLAAYSTKLGVRIGSTYDSVRSIYGGNARENARHFVVLYRSGVPGLTATVPRKNVALPEIVTIVVGGQRVSSISIYIDRAGES
jgi:hypothetical protein